MNGRLGPHRRFDWLELDLGHVKAIRKALSCSVNDVVLASVTGAVRDFLIRRRVRPEAIEFRIAAPVSVRTDAEQGQMGNRVSSWIVRLPLDEPDPRRQLARIREATLELKDSKQALGVDTMMKMAEYTPSVLMSLGVRAASGPINMIVTNVPGPQFPLYMLGARLDSLFPMVPLLDGTAVGVALFSYDGKLCWGFNGDYNLMPDLRVFAMAVASSFRELARIAGVALDSVRCPEVMPLVDFDAGNATEPSIGSILGTPEIDGIAAAGEAERHLDDPDYSSPRRLIVR